MRRLWRLLCTGGCRHEWHAWWKRPSKGGEVRLLNGEPPGSGVPSSRAFVAAARSDSLGVPEGLGCANRRVPRPKRFVSARRE